MIIMMIIIYINIIIIILCTYQVRDGILNTNRAAHFLSPFLYLSAIFECKYYTLPSKN
jgi:hypothetical protein